MVDEDHIQQLLYHSKAEIVFRPWWDRLEDLLIYSLLMLGIVLAPTAMVMESPLHCTICKDDLCNPLKYFEGMAVDPGYCEEFVKQYCLVNGSIDSFLLYFPFILLLISLVMVALEKTFIAVFRSSKKLERFYNLLMSHNILGQDEIKISGDKSKSVVVMEELFKTSKDVFYNSYLIRTVLELIVISLFFFYLLFIGIPVIIFSNNIIFCDVNGYFYACSGHPREFYKIVLSISLVIILLYILINVYNLSWILKPVRSKMSFIVCNIKNSMEKNIKEEDNYSFEDYFTKDKDLKILLDLLALNQDVGTAVAAFGLFNKVWTPSFLFQRFTWFYFQDFYDAFSCKILDITLKKLPKIGIRIQVTNTARKKNIIIYFRYLLYADVLVRNCQT